MTSRRASARRTTCSATAARPSRRGGASTTSRSRWIRRHICSGVANENRNWFDCAINAAGTACSGVALPTNNDGIAQNNEIGPGSATSSGLRPNAISILKIQRQSNVEIMASVSHQLTSRVCRCRRATITGRSRTCTNSDRTLVGRSQYTSFTAPMPRIASPSLAGGIDETLSACWTRPGCR